MPVLKELAAYLVIERLYKEMALLPDSPVKEGRRTIRTILVIDEAHNYLSQKNIFLQRIIREGRSKGIVVFFASQSPNGLDSGIHFTHLSPKEIIMKTRVDTLVSPTDRAGNTVFRLLGAISFSHFLNDMLQSLILAIYPLLKNTFFLSFTQIGLITLTYQVTASLLQPIVGFYTDHYPKPYSLSIGMGCTLAGLMTLALAPNYDMVLIAAALVGTGSSIFHPESSRVARMASGGRYGLAQSIFQVGGNAGTATGPLLAAWIIIPRGRTSLAWFSVAALLATVVLWQVGDWYKHQLSQRKELTKSHQLPQGALPVGTVAGAMLVMLILIFSKFFYLASLHSYYIFYLMSKFHLSVQSAQVHLFVFLFAVAVGTVLGGPIGDRIGRKRVIWVSILGVAPLTLILPYANLTWTGPLTFLIGLILASAFSAILVFAQELIPGKVGMVSGLFFGLAFGMAGIGAAVLGKLADSHGIEYVYRLCSFLPLLGIFTAFLPDIRKPSHEQSDRPSKPRCNTTTDHPDNAPA